MDSRAQKQYVCRETCVIDEGHSYTSPVVDSGEADNVWNRMRLYFAEKAAVQARIWISNHPEPITCGQPDITGSYTDLLLYTGGVRGRYLQFTLYGQGRLSAFSVSYPKETFVRYLPEIYWGNEQLERFLAVFQNDYLDREEEIDQFYQQLDPLHCRVAQLSQLGEWLDSEAFLFAAEAARRRLMGYAALLNRMKGTVNGVKLLAYLITGHHPLVQEQPGSDAFSLLLPEEPSDTEKELLNRLLPVYIPYPLTCSLLYTYDDAALDGGSYVGYCRCALPKAVYVGQARLGDLLCL